MRHFLLHHLLREAATRAGGRPAVLDGDRCLTYAELDRRSDQLAHLLRALGVLPGDRVGLYLDKSLEAVIGIYGTLKAGAAYVPLDAKAPPPRLAQVVRSCGMRHLLTAVGKATTWRALLEPASGVGVLLALDGAPPADATPPSVRVVGPAAMRDQPASPPDSEITVDLDPAYILYTSGSTGVPKGVVLTHRNALSFVDWSVEAFAVSGSDRLSSAAPFHFDLSVFDLFAAASAAATLVLVPPTALTLPQELRDFILRTSISVWYSVPSLLSLLVVRGGLRRAGLPSLRTVLFAGEVFPTPHLRRLMQMLPGARFANLYGPTETNVCMWFDVPRPLPAGDDPVPIGRAIDNLHVFARTHDGRLVTAGEVGELCVRGSSVMRGYWGDPVATARSFLLSRSGPVWMRQPTVRATWCGCSMTATTVSSAAGTARSRPVAIALNLVRSSRRCTATRRLRNAPPSPCRTTWSAIGSGLMWS